MPYNGSNTKQVRIAEKAAQRAELAKIDFLKSCLATTSGRLWFYDLLSACHLFSDPFTGNALHEAFLKGERNVGLRIFADITAHCPDQYISMMKDANGRRTELDSKLSLSLSPAERDLSPDDGWDAEGPIYPGSDLYPDSIPGDAQ
jgi:hypothetical protein